ncbi:OmpW/AlkL family protein [Pseudoduganella violaceinigra]|uniref:OmpW/AlkL family protein n=1 Tax=Pseudoduganella violaceinigra TaxID=246602 RepID=UPI000412AA03|nr:OmpW family outer membrane protein [Pseudoduganella violaceinigra]
MTKRINNTVKLLAVVAALGAASGAHAQAKGEWLGKIGFNRISPNVTSGDVTAPSKPGIKAEVGSDTKPIFSVGYMITDNVSTELMLGAPYKHTLYGAGSIEGTGKLATAEALPPTLFLQYRLFESTAAVRPYVGIGYSYAYFRKETGSAQLTAVLNAGGTPSTYSLDAKHAVSAVIGGTVKISDRYYADMNVVKTKLKTRAHFSTGQTLDIKLDPLAVSLAIGYRF